MSAPNTDVEKQEKKHSTPLIGMAAVVLFALLLLGGLMMWTSGNGNDPEGAETQVDGRTGVEEPAENVLEETN